MRSLKKVEENPVIEVTPPAPPPRVLAAFRPGCIIVGSATVSGGLTAKSKVIARNKREVIHTVDNADIVTRSLKLKKDVDYLCRTGCANTPLGWYAPLRVAEEIRAKAAPLREQAKALNAEAIAAGSERRIAVAIGVARLDLDAASAADLAADLAERLRRLRGALRAGSVRERKVGRRVERDGTRSALLALRNFDALLVEESRRLFLAAIRDAKVAKATILALLELLNGRTSPEDAAKGVRLHNLDRAIAHFEALAKEI